ncbi:hypothetical protein ABEB36_006375 [Hypothenemus hampei]|uniref:Beta-hexosaminidase n=1 Tax=Hypothenemus hampei TaxID=57062 RepID=A0ABD1EQC0_HYPHA
MLIKTLILLNFYVLFTIGTSLWHYECLESYCEKTLTTSNTSNGLSLSECNILCHNGAAIWPKPTGNVTVSDLVEIDLKSFTFTTTPQTAITSLVTEAFDIFTKQIKKFVSCKVFLGKSNAIDVASVQVVFNILDQKLDLMTFGTDESYRIETQLTNNSVVYVNVTAPSFFGARHALETLSQLVVYDDIRQRTLFPSNIFIVDGPIYSWRGISLDTSRNYVTPKAIKRTLRAMAASKLNTLHWHLTDTASFPYVSKSHPELSEYGAYSPSKVYNNDTVKTLIEYARVRGIRVVPELDSPAHVGEGWQTTGVVTCFNWKPWDDYCVEPPCGQFDPSQDKLYDILEDVYGDFLSQFDPEVFHMGGDEVNVNCWNSTSNLTKWMVEEKGWNLTKEDFLDKLWPYFQDEASKRLYKAAGKEIPIILWTSELTFLDNVQEILPPSKYLLQVWERSDDLRIQTLLEKNYSLILSNYDALYLDCGFGGWVDDGQNWCSPYKTWQTIYDNKPEVIAGNRTSQILGGETALWTEESGTNSLDSRLWPRAAAFAETLWTSPSTNWEQAQERFLIHRERLVALGIDADEIQPEWCRRNQHNCRL